MKTIEKEKILKQIDLPDYYIKKGCLAYYIVEQGTFKILVGLYIDSSIDKNVFYVQYFVQPLFFPFVSYIFNFGNRIGSQCWKTTDIDRINTFFKKHEKFNSFEEIIRWISRRYNTDTTYQYQSLGYMYFIIGNSEKAKEELTLIIKKENNLFVPDWLKSDIEDTKQILSLIESNKKEDVFCLLTKWQEKTMCSLELL